MDQIRTVERIMSLFKNNSELVDTVRQVVEENADLKKQMEKIQKEKLIGLKAYLIDQTETVQDTQVIKSIVNIPDAEKIRDLAFQLRSEKKNLVLILGAIINGKPNLSIMITDDLIEQNKWDAGQIVREAAKKMQGGGGGQAFYATAGGKNPDGLQEAVNTAFKLLFEVR